MNPNDNINFDKPVAYDPDGRPLYYRPERPVSPVINANPAIPQNNNPNSRPVSPPVFNPAEAQPVNTPTQYVATEEIDSEPYADPLTEDYSAPPISTKPLPRIPVEVKARHDESNSIYPELNLAPSEYVVIRLRRHPIGIVQIWLVVFAIFVALLLSTVMITNALNFDSGTKAFIAIIGLIMSGLTFLFGALATRVYQMNKFFITNERVINHIQRTMFSSRKQSIGLDGVEDVSYRQSGVFQTLLNYGSVRLATVGDETTYRFNFVENPIGQIGTINKAIQEYDIRRGSRRRR